MRPRLLAAAAILAALALDLLVKHFLLANAATWDGRTLLPGLLDTHYAWNRGISFSLFWQNGDFGSEVLAAFLMTVTLVFAVSALRTDKKLVAAGLGLIVGGALGNMADRYNHGAVFDFLVVRLGSLMLFVCNTADIFISAGAVLFIADTVFANRHHARP